MLKALDPEEEIADEEDTAIPIVTSKTALHAMEQVHTFVMQQREDNQSLATCHVIGKMLTGHVKTCDYTAQY